MTKDYLKKEPSKTERVLYELMVRQHDLEHRILSTSAHAVALGLLLGADPEKLAELLVNGQEQIKEYGDRINKQMDELQAARQKDKEGKDITEAHEHP